MFQPKYIFRGAFAIRAIISIGILIVGTLQVALASPLDAPARITHRGTLNYPDSLADEAVYGKVVIKFTIETDGSVTKPTVVFASHPLFVAAALRALFSSKFEPAIEHGLKVRSNFTDEYIFTIERDVFRAAHGSFNLPEKSPDSTPAQFQYDHPPRVLTVCDPVYPRDLFLAGVKGSADAVFILGPDGRVAAVKITGCSNPEFGAALLAAIETWKFSPAERQGVPTMTLLSRHHEFTTSLRVLPDGYSARTVLHELRTDKGLVDSSALDSPLRRVYEVPPQYPLQFEAEKVSGHATIAFVVNHDGAVMFPKVQSATRPEFGWAAATAVQQWFYDVPKLKGKPVDVRTTVSFDFTPTS